METHCNFNINADFEESALQKNIIRLPAFISEFQKQNFFICTLTNNKL